MPCYIIKYLLIRAQNEIYRLQSRVDTLEADRNRLEIEAERAALAAAKAREDLRKLHDESTRLVFFVWQILYSNL